MSVKITVKKGSTCTFVEPEDVVYMEKMGRRIRLITAEDEMVFYGRFCDMKDRLDGRFMGIHRSYIINMDAVTHMAEGHITFEEGRSVYFGRDKFKEAVRMMERYHAEKGKK